MNNSYRLRRAGIVLCAIVSLLVVVACSPDLLQQQSTTTVQPSPANTTVSPQGAAADVLATLPVKGRAAKTGYARTQFGDGWETQKGCDTRNIILHRDLIDIAVNAKCQIVSGLLHDPYTGKDIQFQRGADTSDDIQIDHVVALSDAWQKGAQQLTPEKRVQLANDPLELLAVDGPSNQQKSDGDAATWLPANKAFRCQYVARQIAVKAAYGLWVTQAEHDAMANILSTCPGQALPSA
jgi:hypothetical protein